MIRSLQSFSRRRRSVAGEARTGVDLGGDRSEAKEQDLSPPGATVGPYRPPGVF